MSFSKSNPLISVAVACYNQEQFIRDALDSIVAQEHDFPWEILIADDASTDKTPEIIREYQEQHAQTIRILPRQKNLGCPKNGLDLLEQCKGKYVALLDGDDYWTDNHKLQKQVTAMEGEESCIFSFHQCECIDHEGNITKILPEVEQLPHKVELERFIKNAYMAHTSTMIFEREGFNKTLRQFSTSNKTYDMLFPIIGSLHAPALFIETPMSRYRVLSNENAITAKKKSEVHSMAAHRWLEIARRVEGELKDVALDKAATKFYHASTGYLEEQQKWKSFTHLIHHYLHRKWDHYVDPSMRSQHLRTLLSSIFRRVVHTP